MELEDCALSSSSIVSHPAVSALHQVAPQVEGDVTRVDDGDDARVGRVEPHCPVVYTRMILLLTKMSSWWSGG
eukprot:2220555-Prymnesium_polylepis.1